MAAFDTKEYRNIFAEIGKSQEEIEKKIKDAVDVFFFGSEEERIYHPAGEDMGYLEDTGNHDARTEGMSYGMMMCVQLNMKEEFDRIWKWSKTYMFMDEGWNEGYFAWSCALNGDKNAMGPAPDGEEFYAMALFFASHRWGDGEGIFNYSQEARNILSACIHKGSADRIGHSLWNVEKKQILFTGDSDFTDPSYHLPHFYDLFACWANEEDKEFWKEAAMVSREFLAKACHPVTGMCPEYSDYDGQVLAEKPRNAGRGEKFYSDAYRTAANIGLDALWFGKDAGHYAAPVRLMKFLKTDLEAARCVYEVDGTPLEMTVLHPLGLLATTAQGALAVEKDSADWEVAKQWVEWFWNQPLREGDRRYYDNCLYMFAILALSGNYRIYE